MNSCIFCLEGGDLVHNVKCRCNFCFHLACYEKYDRKTLCPMCRATVGELYIPPPTEQLTEIRETRETLTVQIEEFGAQQRREQCRRRRIHVTCVASCTIVAILLIVVIRLIN